MLPPNVANEIKHPFINPKKYSVVLGLSVCNTANTDIVMEIINTSQIAMYLNITLTELQSKYDIPDNPENVDKLSIVNS